MIRINLIPYRDERRQRKILRYLGVAFGAIGMTLLLAFAANTYASMQLADKQSELQDLRAKNKALKKKIGELSKFKQIEKEVKKKLALVDSLQKGRFRSLNTLLGLSGAIPAHVWLTDARELSGRILLNGKGQSNRAVAAFMRALEKSDVFADVDLKLIKREEVNGVPLRSFTLKMKRVDNISAATKNKGGKPS